MKWISLTLLLLLTGCVNPENTSNTRLIWVRIWLTNKWSIGEYKTKEQVDAFLKDINKCDDRYDDRLIEFGDFYVNKEQIKAIRIG